MSQIRILTDSTSDIPPEIAERLHITIVPAYVQIDNQSYRDSSSPEGLSREEFYAQLPKMSTVPTTSVPPAREFTMAYRSLIGQASEIIAIVLSRTLSGMYNVALLGAQDVPEIPVHVVDSGQVTMGLGWIVIAAAEAAAEGQSTQEILSIIEDMKHRIHVYAVLDTLEYLRRSGRVNWAQAKAAQILGIKPMVRVLLGQVESLGQTRTRRHAIDRLVDTTRNLGSLERLAILHTQAPDLEAFRRRLADFFPLRKMLTVAVTTIIGAHTGPRGLGVAVVTTRTKEI